MAALDGRTSIERLMPATIGFGRYVAESEGRPRVESDSCRVSPETLTTSMRKRRDVPQATVPPSMYGQSPRVARSSDVSEAEAAASRRKGSQREAGTTRSCWRSREMRLDFTASNLWREAGQDKRA